MKLIGIFLTIIIGAFLVPTSHAMYFPEVDSSEESSIIFVRMEAQPSSKIVHFSWEVESEQNGGAFLIEKSIDDGLTWTKVRSVQSIGTHNEQHTYRVSEINTVEEVNEYFRITRIDAEGKMLVLDSVNVNHPILQNMKLIPNPKNANNSTTVSCESLICSDAKLEIYDKEGELVFAKNLDLLKGYNRCEVELKRFDPGEYRVMIRNEYENTMTKRLVVY
jgi:hypothetical protein